MSLPRRTGKCGLRAYGTAPVVWGGDPGHDHRWRSVAPRRLRTENDAPNSEVQQSNRGSLHALRDTEACSCGAWRGELGLEPTPEMFVAHLVTIFAEVRRVLRPWGTCFLNIGDTYIAQPKQARPDGEVSKSKELPRGGGRWGGGGMSALGLKPKDMALVPARLAIALQADGWWVRNWIIWDKPNSMPSSVTDRFACTYEPVLFLAKSRRYFFDLDAVREPYAPSTIERITQPNAIAGTQGQGGKQLSADFPWSDAGNGNRSARMAHGLGAKFASKYGLDEKGHRERPAAGRSMLPDQWDEDYGGNPLGKNPGDVFTIPSSGYPGAHFATFPEALPRRLIAVGTSEKGNCSECGRPWQRETEVEYEEAGQGNSNMARKGAKVTERGNGSATIEGAGDLGRYETRMLASRRTVGWKPTCRHVAAATAPAVVLDPFAGSGTTLAVARDMGRQSIGIELQEDYLAMIVQRVQQEALWGAVDLSESSASPTPDTAHSTGEVRHGRGADHPEERPRGEA